jgi:hypothetical protein
MKLMKNSEKPVADGVGIITAATEKNVKRPVWIIIGGQKVWLRKCNHCGNTVYHKEPNTFYISRKHNKRCEKCRQSSGTGNPFYGHRHTPENKKLYSRRSSGSNNPMYGKYGADHPKFGISAGGVKRHSIQSRMKMSATKKASGKYIGNLNAATRQDVRRKIRLSVINHIREKIKQDLRPSYNPSACEYLDGLNESRGWNLQHALNGGEIYIKELGYWLDGYDAANNIVVEYNEPKHYNIDGTMKERDVNRMQEIKKLYGCRYLVYNERDNRIYEY